MLSTVFIHMVAEVRHSLKKVSIMDIIPLDMEFPVAELIICMGRKFISMLVNLQRNF